MRFTCISGVEGRQTHITCEPGDYDGRPPVTTLQVANRMRSLNADRFAVACALLFAKYVSGAFRIDKEMGPATATALGRFFEPRKLLFEGVSLVPAAIPIGERSALVVADGRAARNRAPGIVTIGFADEQAFSSYLSPMELRFASNASLFAATPAEKPGRSSRSRPCSPTTSPFDGSCHFGPTMTAKNAFSVAGGCSPRSTSPSRSSIERRGRKARRRHTRLLPGAGHQIAGGSRA